MTATPQCMEALALANERRSANRRYKSHLASLPRDVGSGLLADALENEDETLMGMDIQAALVSVNRIGPNRARLILRAAGVLGVSRKVRELSPRQREEIAMTLRFGR